MEDVDSSDSRRSPLVSVVIPTFDRADVVGDAVASALGQSYSNLEILVVDDGSRDDTASRLASRFGDDKRVHYASRENGGAGAARNTALKMAAGEYVAFLDSDDTWAPWKLELQIQHMEQHFELGMTWSDFSAVSDSGELLHERYLRQMYRNMRGRKLGELFSERHPVAAAPRSRPDLARIPVYSGDVFREMLLGSIVHTSTVVLRRSTLEAVGLFDEKIRPNGEDFDFHLRTVRVASVGFIDTPTALYRIGAPDQLTADDRMILLARNGLDTVLTCLQVSADDRRVSTAVARAAIANAQAWLGRELLASGANREARRHLWSAWRRHPGRGTTKSLLKSFLARHAGANGRHAHPGEPTSEPLDS